MSRRAGVAAYMGFIGPIPIGSNSAFKAPTAIKSATTPAAACYSTATFNAIGVNPSAMVANSFAVTNGVTINGVATPLSGYNVLARTGWTDTNGAVMGQLLVRPPLGVFVPWRRAGACERC